MAVSLFGQLLFQVGKGKGRTVAFFKALTDENDQSETRLYIFDEKLSDAAGLSARIEKGTSFFGAEKHVKRIGSVTIVGDTYDTTDTASDLTSPGDLVTGKLIVSPAGKGSNFFGVQWSIPIIGQTTFKHPTAQFVGNGMDAKTVTGTFVQTDVTDAAKIKKFIISLYEYK